MEAKTFTGVDEFTGVSYEFTISGIDFDIIDGAKLVLFDISTALGKASSSEWVNEDGTVERTDSNIKINDVGIEGLFDLSEKPGLMPSNDYLPLAAIFDALDEMIEGKND